ncbi:hypothetical protein [Micromonospora sp. NPDC005313]|uniref:hypothetical protein n=1 Tax=Micromonospora sp. NPDC005313 TaxID=3154296 RepID=UPI00339E0305
MSALRLPRTVLTESFRHLRDCGAGRRECVLYWCADQDEPDLVTRSVHPVHRAGRAGYEVNSDWVTQFFLDLRRSRETVRVQVHTHPREAGHSGTDDRFALVPAAGFLSLVIPNFATGPVSLADTVLVEMGDDGDWKPTVTEEVLEVE